MNRRLFWKLCLIIATGVVAFFYLLTAITSRTEEGMSLLDIEHRQTLTAWGKEAERLYLAGDKQALELWLKQLQQREKTWVAIVSYQIGHIAGDKLRQSFYQGYNLGRNVDWKVHLYFEDNPIMEVPFTGQQVSFLIQLPERMRPGSHWQYVQIIMRIILPMIILALLSVLLYRHIMAPLKQLERATKDFTQGNFEVRVRQLLGRRSDELSELAHTFDQMAARIGELIISQRQLIADLSHELRTPLTRLDIAVQSLHQDRDKQENIDRIGRESCLIRKLVEDTLTLAWLDNEQPQLQDESLDLVDLLDILIEDARFEFPDREIDIHLPSSAEISNSSHRALGQALENILRNALRYTPPGQKVSVWLEELAGQYQIQIKDQGPGVPQEHLNTIFQPFFRLDESRVANSDSFGLGLALAQRQLAAVKATVTAANIQPSGLCMTIILPKQ